MSDKKYVTYADFGAVGDGVTDDFEAIWRAHEYANEKGLPIVTDDGKTYYVHETRIDGAVREAIIKTDVTWGTSKFIIDDSDIVSYDGTGRVLKNIFSIESDYAPVTVTDPEVLSKIGSIGEGTKKINLSLGYPAFLIIYNENQRVFKRCGPSYVKIGLHKGSVQKELIVIDADGNVDESTPFMFNYDELTKIEILRLDIKPITVKGGIFTTRASRLDAVNPATGGTASYIERGISINRSFTTLDGVEHYVEGEVSTYEFRDKGLRGAHYYGFYAAKRANDILIKNCVFTGRRYYALCGTYEFTGVMVNKIRLEGCTQSNFEIVNEEGKTVYSMAGSPVSKTKYCWGIGGTDFCKNMEYRDCILSRFDAHQGLYNGKLINSTINFMELTGKGEMYIENLDFRSSSSGANLLVYLRDDYGSTWDGTITFKNCTAHFAPGNAYVFFHLYSNWDFGYKCHFPNLVLDNLKVEGLGESPTVHLKIRTEEPNMNLLTCAATPRKNADGTIDEGNMNNANPIIAPDFIKVINNECGAKYLIENIPFYKNTELEGVEKCSERAPSLWG